MRDCFTLLRETIKALSGQEPGALLPEWAHDLTEIETKRRAPKVYGTLRKGWIEVLDNEPLLKRAVNYPLDTHGSALPECGMIGMTGIKAHIDPGDPVRGPLVGVIGPDCGLWVRTNRGIRKAWSISELWEVRPDCRV